MIFFTKGACELSVYWRLIGKNLYICSDLYKENFAFICLCEFMTEKLDRYDRHILATLQDDGRISNQQLADQVGLSSAACWRRVKTLDEKGILKKYTALVNPEALGYDLCVLIMVTLIRHQQDHATEFQQAVQGYPEVLQCFAVTGDADYVLRVIIQSMAAYDRFLNDKIFSLPGVSQVRSNFALREIKNETAIPIDL